MNLNDMFLPNQTSAGNPRVISSTVVYRVPYVACEG